MENWLLLNWRGFRFLYLKQNQNVPLLSKLVPRISNSYLGEYNILEYYFLKYYSTKNYTLSYYEIIFSKQLFWRIRCSYIYGTVVEEEDPALQKTMFAEFQQLLEALKNINRWEKERVSCVLTEWFTNFQQKWVRTRTRGQTPVRYLHLTSSRYLL